MAKQNLEILEALSAPLGEVISSVARGVAEAQQALDEHTIQTFQSVYGGDTGMLEELRQMGYSPTWYRIPEVSAEIQMSLTISANSLEGGRGPGGIGRTRKFELLSAPIDANYVNSYNYDIRGSSKVKFTIVPVPPSPQAEEMKVVPLLTGKTIADAFDLLDRLNIPYAFAPNLDLDPASVDTSQTIEATQPGAGQILRKGQQLLITKLNGS